MNLVARDVDVRNRLGVLDVGDEAARRDRIHLAGIVMGAAGHPPAARHDIGVAIGGMEMGPGIVPRLPLDQDAIDAGLVGIRRQVAVFIHVALMLKKPANNPNLYMT